MADGGEVISTHKPGILGSWVETALSGSWDVDGCTSASLVDDILSGVVDSLVGTTVDDGVVVNIGPGTRDVEVVRRGLAVGV